MKISDILTLFFIIIIVLLFLLSLCSIAGCKTKEITITNDPERFIQTTFKIGLRKH